VFERLRSKEKNDLPLHACLAVDARVIEAVQMQQQICLRPQIERLMDSAVE